VSIHSRYFDAPLHWWPRFSEAQSAAFAMGDEEGATEYEVVRVARDMTRFGT
jgi:hypothetical protein